MNRESERKRLVELIGSKVCDDYSPNCDEYSPHTCEKCYANNCRIGELADYLLDNGVVVPPVKVGDKYVMDTAKSIFKAWNDVTGAVCEGTSWYYELESVIEDIVKLSFGAGVLYREEAEKALKGDAGV